MDAQGAPDGPRIDHGSGKVGVKMAPEIGHETYEPYAHDAYQPTYSRPEDIPHERYGRTTSLNVLNVLTPQDRQNAIMAIGNSMAPGGHAVVCGRKWGGDVARSRQNPDYPPPEEPNSVITGAGNRARYQHGYAHSQELVDELQNHLGDGYSVSPAQIGAVGAHIIKHPMQI